MVRGVSRRARCRRTCLRGSFRRASAQFGWSHVRRRVALLVEHLPRHPRFSIGQSDDKRIGGTPKGACRSGGPPPTLIPCRVTGRRQPSTRGNAECPRPETCSYPSSNRPADYPDPDAHPPPSTDAATPRAPHPYHRYPPPPASHNTDAPPTRNPRRNAECHPPERADSD